MYDYELLRGSDGTGLAVLSHITQNRLVGSSTLIVDSVDNWPQKFIATSGTVGSNGFMTPSSIREFVGHLDAGNIIIDSWEPGFVNDGHTAGQVVVVKQTAGWANRVADAGTQMNNFINTNGDWRALTGVTYSGYNGQKDYLLTTATDLRNTLPLGSRVRLTRPTAAPTRSMLFDLNASQFATKAAPVGVNIVNTFTIEAMVRVDRLNGGSSMWFSRTDATAANGLYSQVNAKGQLTIIYTNGGVATGWNTKESVNGQEFVHVAISVSSISGKVLGGMYINGHPVLVTNTVNNATSINNVGNITVGRWDNPSQYFSGAISELRFWNTARTQQQIRDNMGLNLVGNEVGLIGLWRGDGDFQDRTANANHLTASGGAIATHAANPFNTNEHGIVHEVTNNQVRLFAGKGFLPNIGYSAVAYSTADNPLGAPNQKEYWSQRRLLLDVTNTANAAPDNTWKELPWTDTPVPAGPWAIEYQGVFTLVHSGGVQTGLIQIQPMGVAPTAEVGPDWMQSQTYFHASGGITDGYFVNKATGKCEVTLAAMTTIKQWGIHTNAGGAAYQTYLEAPPYYIKWQSQYA